MSKSNHYVFTSKDLPIASEGDANHRRVDGLQGLRPGDILIYDFRDPTKVVDCTASFSRFCGAAASSVGADDARPSGEGLSVIQWNIERGYKLPGIVEELRAVDADLLILQELDISCQRSAYANCPLEIARALNALVIFVCEFHELPSTVDCQRDANAESGCCFGFHGNAIVSRRHTIHSIRAFPHSAGRDWARLGIERREPRVGTRYVLTGCVDHCYRITTAKSINGSFSSQSSLPEGASQGVAGATYDRAFARLQLYTLHLEVFCGPLLRLRQLADALNDAKMCRRQFYDTVASMPDGRTPLSPVTRIRDFNTPDKVSTTRTAPHPQGKSFEEGLVLNPAASIYVQAPPIPADVAPAWRQFSVVLGGDLNTMMHGIVRLSRTYCTDRMRWLSLGESEAEWLQRKVLATARAPPPAPGRAGPLSNASPTAASRESAWIGSDAANGTGLVGALARWYWRWVYGLRTEERLRLCNRELRLFDVFDKRRDVTINNPDYHGFVTGKLDWLLLSNVGVVSSRMGNDHYLLSDHKYLVNHIVLPPFAGAAEAHKKWREGLAAFGPEDALADADRVKHVDPASLAFEAHARSASWLTTALRTTVRVSAAAAAAYGIAYIVRQRGGILTL